MGQKDIISKAILRNIAKDVATHILKIEIQDDMELIDKEFTRIEKRDADLVFKNGNDIVHIEIQNNNHFQMHHRMLRYYSDIINVKKGEEMLSVDIERMPSFSIGMERGIERGVEKGIERGIFDTAIVMINKFNLSIDDIVKELNIKKEAIKEVFL